MILLEPVLNVKKFRAPSVLLQGLAAGQTRLNENHPIFPAISANHSSLQAGIGGEERVADEISKHHFPSNYHFFHDLSLNSTSLFQMDTFLLTPYYGLIFEVKNISGTLRFVDNPPQLIQIKENGQIKGYDSPAAQVERYAELLSIWLQNRNIYLPIFVVVVLAYPKQIVEKAPAKVKVIFPNLIPQFIRSIPQNTKKLDNDTFNWLSAELINSHVPFIPKPICELYNIPKGDIRTGVMCVVCGHIGMIKTIRSWYCPKCGTVDPLAFKRTVMEWFLLIGRKMTNTDCREFLHVDLKTATRILTGMDLIWEGGKKNRVYIMDFLTSLNPSERVYFFLNGFFFFRTGISSPRTGFSSSERVYPPLERVYLLPNGYILPSNGFIPPPNGPSPFRRDIFPSEML